MTRYIFETVRNWGDISDVYAASNWPVWFACEYASIFYFSLSGCVSKDGMEAWNVQLVRVYLALQEKYNDQVFIPV